MIEIARKLFYKIVPQQIFTNRQRRFWSARNSETGDNHILTYWDNRHEVPNRIKLVDILRNEILEIASAKQFVGSSPISILEFGSHCGPNLDLIKAGSDVALQLHAVEPNPEAISFINQMLPEVFTYKLNDLEFCSSKDLPRKVDICFSNSVFYILASKAAKDVLSKLCSISDTVIIGCELSNIDGDATSFSRTTRSLRHPYKKWFSESGFTIVKKLNAPQPQLSCDGFLVARKNQ